jgi:ribosomal protein S18 acetylase RimI-like enzyme
MRPGYPVSRSPTPISTGSKRRPRQPAASCWWRNVPTAFLGFVAGWIEQTNDPAETLDSSHFGYISDICVLPPFRGQRIAVQLLDGIEQNFRRAGVRRLRINSLAVNTSAQASYEHAGFRPYEILFEKVLGEGWEP